MELKQGMYVKFTEHNDWEGESWHFFIPVTGNEENITKVAALIEERSDDRLVLSTKLYTSEQVDTFLDEEDENGYMAKYNYAESLNMSAINDDSLNYKGSLFK